MIQSRITFDRDFYYVEVKEDRHRIAFLTIERHVAPLVAEHLAAYLLHGDDSNVRLHITIPADD